MKLYVVLVELVIYGDQNTYNIKPDIIIAKMFNSWLFSILVIINLRIF